MQARIYITSHDTSDAACQSRVLADKLSDIANLDTTSD
jgi:hypothetical protein